MELQVVAKYLIIAGVAFVLLGGLLWGLSRLGFGGLPGDISFQRNGVSVYFPIVTCLVLSLVLTVVLNLFFRK